METVTRKPPCGLLAVWKSALRMSFVEIDHPNTPASFSRRTLFSILPAGALGCAGCALAMACPQEQPAAVTSHSWTENSNMTWEQVFRFAFQQDLIPTLKELGAQLGREKLVAMLKTAVDTVVQKKTAGRRQPAINLVTLAANMKNMPPIIQHALDAEILEQSPEAFEYRVTRCLWAKAFRDEDAGDIGYAMVCYPDYAVARGLNPKLKLIRNKTLMQGDDSCGLRYVLEA